MTIIYCNIYIYTLITFAIGALVGAVLVSAGVWFSPITNLIMGGA